MKRATWGVPTLLLIITVALTAWDRIDKLMDSRDAWRDHAKNLEQEIGVLQKRADMDDGRNAAEAAWRRNEERRYDYISDRLTDVMHHLGMHVPVGPFLEPVPEPLSGIVPRGTLGPLATDSTGSGFSP